MQAPPRKAYTYYHKKRDGTLRKATINPTDGKVESDTESPDIQGLADIDEIGCIYNLCNEYPAVEEEIKKLKLPKGWVYLTLRMSDTCIDADKGNAPSGCCIGLM